MNATIEDLRPTIVPKSDQLNSDQLIAGPMTVTITDVRIGSSDEQPINVHYEGEDGRPFRPCKTMRKVLIFAWGPDGREWIGRSMTLYCDPQVKFGGDEVGGIRISHMSDIPDDIEVKLTKTRGKKALHTIKRLATVSTEDIDHAPTVEALKDNFGAAYKANKAPHIRARLKAAYDLRLAALSTTSSSTAQPAKTLEQCREDVENAADAAAAQAIVEAARTTLGREDYAELQKAYRMAWES